MFDLIPNYTTNLPAYMSLGNRHWVSNFGGTYQSNVYPAGYSPLNYALAQGLGSPNHISQWNPMLIGFNLAGNMMTDPALTAQGNQAAYNWGLSIALNARLSSMINSLSSYEAQITEILKSDKLDESQKQRLQAVLDEIKAMKERVEAMLSQGQFSKEDVEAVQGEIYELVKKATETASEIIKEIQEAQQDEQAEDAEDADDDTVSEDDNDGTDGADDVDEEDSTSTDTTVQDEAAGIIGLIFDSVDGAGTKNEQLKNTIAQINENNIVAVFDAWNENYKDSEGSLVSRIHDDEFWINCGNDYVKPMVDAFEINARELGLYAKLIKEFTTVNSELNATWNTDEGKVSQAMDKIHETIKAAETTKSDKAKAAQEKKKAKAEAEKTEKEKKEAQKTEEKKIQFRDDMREILGDDNAEVSDRVQYENGKFVVRIEGKNYYGKDYLTLVEAIQKGIDKGYIKSGKSPEAFVKKEVLKAAA